VRTIAEIPAFMIDFYRFDFICREWNSIVSPNLDNTALTDGYLLEDLAVFESNGGYMISEARLLRLLELVAKRDGYFN